MESQLEINARKLNNQLGISFDPDLTTRTQININVHPSNEADAASLRDSDLEDMMNSSDDEGEGSPLDQPQRNRPGNLTYQKISYGLRVNVIYSRKILEMSYREISNSLNVNYNSVRNIIKQHDDGNNPELINKKLKKNAADGQGISQGDTKQIGISGNSKKIRKNKISSGNRMRFMIAHGQEFKEDTTPNF